MPIMPFGGPWGRGKIGGHKHAYLRWVPNAQRSTGERFQCRLSRAPVMLLTPGSRHGSNVGHYT